MLTCLSLSANAAASAWPPSCLDEIATAYNVPTTLIDAVHEREGGKPGQRSRQNKNKTYDIAWMQINSVHLPMLAQRGITEDHLLHQVCVNVAVGVWMLRSNQDASAGSWRDALCLYNTGLRCHRTSVGQRYADDVLRRWNKRMPAATPSITAGHP